MSWHATTVPHVAQMIDGVIYDRTYTGLEPGNGTILASDPNYVYAFGKRVSAGSTTQFYIDRLPIGGTVWEHYNPPTLSNHDKNSGIMFVRQEHDTCGEQYIYCSQNNQVDASTHTYFYRRKLSAPNTDPWTLVLENTRGLLEYNNICQSIGDNGIRDVTTLKPTLVGNGVDVGVGPYTGVYHSANCGADWTVEDSPVGSWLRWGNSQFPARLSDGRLVFSLSNTVDGHGFNTTIDGVNYQRLPTNLSIKSVDYGRMQTYSDGVKIVHTPEVRPVWGTMAGDDWASITFPAAVNALFGNGQGAIYYDTGIKAWWLGHKQYLFLFSRDFTEMFGQWDYSWITGSTVHLIGDAVFIGKLTHATGGW